MAIQFARARYISRSTGGNAVRSAAYNGLDAIAAERTGEVFHFRHRDAPAHHAMLQISGVDNAVCLWVHLLHSAYHCPEYAFTPTACIAMKRCWDSTFKGAHTTTDGRSR